MWIILGHQSMTRFQGGIQQPDMLRIFFSTQQSFFSYLMVHNGQHSPAAAASSNSPFGYFTVPFLVPYLQWRWRPWNRWQFGANGPSHLTDGVTAFPANPTVVLNKFVSNQIFFSRESPIKRRIIITLIRIRLARGI